MVIEDCLVFTPPAASNWKRLTFYQKVGTSSTTFVYNPQQEWWKFVSCIYKMKRGKIRSMSVTNNQPQETEVDGRSVSPFSFRCISLSLLFLCVSHNTHRVTLGMMPLQKKREVLYFATRTPPFTSASHSSSQVEATQQTRMRIGFRVGVVKLLFLSIIFP